MKKLLHTLAIFYSGAVYLLILGACSGPESTSPPTETTTDQPAYSVPVAKTEQWERLQNMVLKEYDICQEHCGYDHSCLDRCEQVYKSRLEREYQQLMLEKTTP